MLRISPGKGGAFPSFFELGACQVHSQFHIGLMNWQTKEMAILADTAYKYQQCPVFVAD